MKTLKKIRISIFISAFIALSGFSQSFDSIKNQKIEFNSDFNELSDYQTIFKNIQSFSEKGLDSLDIKIILSGPILGTFLVEMTSEEKNTYDNLYKRYMEFKSTPNYTKIRKIYEITTQIENRLANIRNWEEDKLLLIELGAPAEELESIKLALEKNTDTLKTYKTFFTEYQASKEKELDQNQRIDNKQTLDSLLAQDLSIDIDSLTSLSKKVNKPILLYFTANACVNCKKMEHNILSDTKILNLIIDRFIFCPLYTDSRTKLPENKKYKSSILKRDILTIGDKNLEYQVKLFNISAQPFFVILHSENNIIETTDYHKSNDVHEFMQFLDSIESK